MCIYIYMYMYMYIYIYIYILMHVDWIQETTAKPEQMYAGVLAMAGFPKRTAAADVIWIPNTSSTSLHPKPSVFRNCRVQAKREQIKRIRL